MKTVHVRLLVTSILLVLAACTRSAGGTVDQTAANLENIPAPQQESGYRYIGERLLAAVPEGWHNVLDLDGDNTRYSDFVPEGQSGSDWESRLSFEAIVTDQVSVDPIDMLKAVAAEDASRCSFVDDYNIFSGYENGYQTSVRLFLCGMNKYSNRGEIKLIKIIRGNERVHSIRLMKRIRSFARGEQDFADAEMADWSVFLNRILLCDDTENHPCPATEQVDG